MTFDKPENQPLDKTEQTIPPGDLFASNAPKIEAKPGSSAASDQLLDSKVLPALAISNDKTAGANATKIEAKDWTIAIDLTASLTSDMGVEDKLAKMKQLAKDTDGKSVAFVVHAERLTDQLGLPCELSATSQDAIKDCSTAALKENRAQTEKYLIADGKITPLGTENFANSAQDITNLLQDAAVLAPSKHLGMVLESHGGGASGIETNLGGLTLDDTTGAISQGLKGSGHEKLDMLDYDACDMAELKVLDASKQVANDVVASEAVEWASKTPGGFDAQNIASDMRGLLANSKMSGRELGNEIVRQASDDPNDTGDGRGTPTLANFDLSKFGDFQKSLDHFGAVLAKASYGGHAQELEKDVESTLVPETGHEKWKEHGRDLKVFAQKVEADSQAGTFGKSSPELGLAAADVLANMDQMITAHHGDAKNGYSSTGGLTAQAPGDEMLDSKKLAFELSQLLKLDGKLNDFKRDGVTIKSQQDYVAAVNDMLGILPPGVTIDENKDLQQLIKDRDGVAGADKLPELTRSFNALLKDTDAFATGELELKMEDALARGVKSTQEIYFTTDGEGVAPNWDLFGYSLQTVKK